MGSRKRVVLLIGGLFAVVALVAAYHIMTFVGDVTVAESITTPGSTSWSVTLYPNEQDEREFTLENVGPEDVDVTLSASVSPTGQGVSASLSETSLTIEEGDEQEFEIITSAANSAQPGNYTVEVQVSR